jgi:hypothetical protein
MSDEFRRLRNYISATKLSSAYQPLIIGDLVRDHAGASIDTMAATFHAHENYHDQNYYADLLRSNEPGTPSDVLADMGIVIRQGDIFQLQVNLNNITDQERTAIIRLCEDLARPWHIDRKTLRWTKRHQPSAK